MTPRPSRALQALKTLFHVVSVASRRVLAQTGGAKISGVDPANSEANTRVACKSDVLVQRGRPHDQS